MAVVFTLSGKTEEWDQEGQGCVMTTGESSALSLNVPADSTKQKNSANLPSNSKSAEVIRSRTDLRGLHALWYNAKLPLGEMIFFF